MFVNASRLRPHLKDTHTVIECDELPSRSRRHMVICLEMFRLAMFIPRTCSCIFHATTRFLDVHHRRR